MVEDWNTLGVGEGVGQGKKLSGLGRLTKEPPFYLMRQCRGGVPGKS